MFRLSYHDLVIPAVITLLLLPFAFHISNGRQNIRALVSSYTVAQAAETPPANTTTTAETTTDTPAATDNGTPAPAYDKVTKILGRPEDIKLTPEEQRFVDLVNKERKDRGLNELKVAPLLVTTARGKSKEMHDLNYWGHVTPDKKKSTALYRVLAALPQEPKSMIVGENLYYCSDVLVDSGHQALMNSPTHRANILKPEYKYIGVGAFISDDHKFWVTEHFVDIGY